MRLDPDAQRDTETPPGLPARGKRVASRNGGMARLATMHNLFAGVAMYVAQYRCQSCRGTLSFSQVMDSHGVCPKCGVSSSSTIVRYHTRGVQHKRDWPFFWRRSIVDSTPWVDMNGKEVAITFKRPKEFTHRNSAENQPGAEVLRGWPAKYVILDEAGPLPESIWDSPADLKVGGSQ